MHTRPLSFGRENLLSHNAHSHTAKRLQLLANTQLHDGTPGGKNPGYSLSHMLLHVHNSQLSRVHMPWCATAKNTARNTAS
jgi:hypothetical protein